MRRTPSASGSRGSARGFTFLTLTAPSTPPKLGATIPGDFMNIRTIAAAAVLAASAAAALAADLPTKAYHLYIPGRKPIAPVQGAGKTMLYFAGPVIAKVKVVSVMWSANVAATTKAKIGPFLNAIVHSTFADQFAQYSTNIVGVNGMQGTDQTIVRGTYSGQFIITPANKKKTVTDTQVQTELLAQIAAGHLPASDLNTLYMIFFPSNITIVLDGSKSCVGYGAYHFATSTTVSPSNVFYGVMPDCGGGLNSLTVATSHEFAEAVTDAIPTPGSNPAYPQAWNNAQGYEIADLCEGLSTTLTTKKRSYTITEVFTNSTNACATGTFTSP